MSTPSGASETNGTSATRSADATVLGTHTPLARDTSAAIGRGVELGRYLIMQELGRGATGRVWSAYDGDLDRKVAIKVVAEAIDSPERRKRLLGEAQAMAKIRHPNVVLVHDVGTYEGHLYIAMEFVDGTTLGRWWRSDPPPPPSTRLDAMIAAARGLAAAHAVGLVHRDFKPDNVLVDRDARVRVADFGLAQPIERGGAHDDGAPSWSAAVGTPAYMSPEHHGLGVVDARSDQFSFSVALFEALAGRRPFAGTTIAELAGAALHGEIDVAAAALIPPRIRRVILRGLAARPEDRHASMDELVAALERARRPRWPLLVGLVATVAVGVGAWALQPAAPSDEPCERGPELARAVWSDDVRGRVELVRGELSATYSERIQQRLLGALDSYATSWAELHDEVCRSSLAGGRAGDPLAEQRAACVEDRLAAFAGLVELAEGHAIAAVRADELIAALPALDDCRGDDVSRWEPVPGDAELAATVAALRRRIAEVRLRYAAGGLEHIDGEVEAIVEAARATGYPHVIACALQILAMLRNQRGQPEQAMLLLDEALFQAISAGHDRLAAFIVLRHIEIVAGNPIYDHETERWASLARALLERIGGDEPATAELSVVLGRVLFTRSDFEGALAQYEVAAAAYRHAMGPTDIHTAAAEIDCAAILTQLGRADEGWALATAAEQTIAARFDREHPQTLQALAVLGLIEDARGNTDAAIAKMLDSLERSEVAFGANSRSVSATSFNLVSMLASRGRIDEARASLARSRATWPVVGDAYAEAQFEEAEALLATTAGDLHSALSHVDAAIDLYARNRGPRDLPQWNTRLIRAEILTELERWPEALDIFTAAYPSWRGTSVLAMRPLLDAVIAADALGDHVGVALWLARVEAQQTLGVTEQPLRTVARAIAGAPTPESLAVIRSARDRLAELHFAGHPVVRKIDAWLARSSAVTNAPR